MGAYGKILNCQSSTGNLPSAASAPEIVTSGSRFKTGQNLCYFLNRLVLYKCKLTGVACMKHASLT